MTRLFQSVIDAGGEPDFSNDDLAYHPLGYKWTCPVAGRVDPRTLERAALALLGGDVFRGCMVADGEVTLFLSDDYEDDDVSQCL